MKKSIIAIAASLAALAGSAYAETSVNLYGLVDAGVTYVDDQGGKSNIRMDSGVMNGNRWGLRGREELGNGIAGIFRVESGFSLDNGNSAQGGRLFGRQAFAGLDVANVGTVTFGRQYDFMGDVGNHAIMGNQFGGNFTENDFHLIDGVGGDRVNNSIKFSSANFAGLTFGAMVGLGENSANKSAGRAVSAMIGFKGIPNFSIDAAYTRINGDGVNAKAKGENFGIGASYDFGFGKVNGLATMNKGDWTANSRSSLVAPMPGDTKIKFNVYEAGYTHRFTPQMSAGLGLQYLDSTTKDAKKFDMYGVSLAANYAFSKRTDAYLLAAYHQSKKVDDQFLPVDITGTGASSDNKQTAVRVGLRHKF